MRSASLAAALLALAAHATAQSQAWLRQIGSTQLERLWGAAPDGSGGVYVSGETTTALGGPHQGAFDAWFARYDGAGNRLWIRQLGTASSETFLAASTDSSGGVYLAGVSNGSLGGANLGDYDCALARCDSAGNLTWIRQFGTSAYENVVAVSHDGAGGVYASGTTLGSIGGASTGGYDAWLARYDGSGNPLWIRQFGTPSLEWATAVAMDGSAGAFVIGYTQGALGGPSAGAYDGWIARFDGSGNQLWIRHIGWGFDDWPTSLAPDGTGGVYVGGSSEVIGNPSTLMDWNAWLARYDAAGNRVWLRRIASNWRDYAFATLPDGGGGVYVCGETLGNLGGPNAGYSDPWIARFDAGGNRDWIVQLGSTGDDYARAGASDGAGGVFVGGFTSGNLGGVHAGDVDVWFGRFHGTECSTATPFCTPTITSNFCVPSISGSGTASASNSQPFTIRVAGAEGGRLGLVFYGIDNSNWTPGLWAPGSMSFTCVKPPVQRMPAQNTGGTLNACDGSLSIDWNAFVASTTGALGVPFASGSQVFAQAWFRDPPAPGGSNLTNGLAISLCP